MSWVQTAYVGQKVVCVEEVGRILAEHPMPSPIKVGQIYTIKSIASSDWIESGVVFEVWEVDCGEISSDAFRPVKDTTQEVEKLKGLLDPKNHTPEKDLVDA